MEITILALTIQRGFRATAAFATLRSSAKTTLGRFFPELLRREGLLR